MHVQDYLKTHTIEELQEEFSIVVTDYPDRVVLNYNQIESPRFNPICDECRALILKKGTWEVLARSFDRFYNVGEGESGKDFPVSTARIEEKRDGTLISLYYDPATKEWTPATRKMAYAEGSMANGVMFADLFKKAVKDTKVMEFVENHYTNFTYVFELTSPFNRIVTPYDDTTVTLIGIRNNLNGYEVGRQGLDYTADQMEIERPKYYDCNSIDEIVAMADKLGSMEEGYVMTVDRDGSLWRLKCKNPKYVAIAHMRENGGIHPKRILTLIMDNEHHEYLSYFPEDKKYFDWVGLRWAEVVVRINGIWHDAKNCQEQKEYALFIQNHTLHNFENGILFQKRKGIDIQDAMKKMGSKKIVKAMGMDKAFAKHFGLVVEEEV